MIANGYRFVEKLQEKTFFIAFKDKNFKYS